VSRIAPVALGGACAVATTMAVGWWGLALVGGALGLLTQASSRPAGVGAAAGAGGWTVLLAWNATQGPTGMLAEVVGDTLGVPGVAFFALTLLFAAAVGGLSAAVAGGLKRAARATLRN
jgi:hypothetical protein